MITINSIVKIDKDKITEWLETSEYSKHDVLQKKFPIDNVINFEYVVTHINEETNAIKLQLLKDNALDSYKYCGATFDFFDTLRLDHLIFVRQLKEGLKFKVIWYLKTHGTYNMSADSQITEEYTSYFDALEALDTHNTDKSFFHAEVLCIGISDKAFSIKTIKK